MVHTRRGAALVVAFMNLALACAGCGYAVPALQSPIQSATPTFTPFPTWTQSAPATAAVAAATATVASIHATATPIPTPADTATPTVIPTITQTPTPGPSPTPNTQATSAAVFATITALAATPTYPPTSTPRPERTPIGAGPGEDIPPTALFSSGDIAVVSLSEQVYRGSAADVTIKTKPGVLCTLQISRAAGTTARLEPIPGTATRQSGTDGVIAWIWTVDSDEPVGSMTLMVDCGAVGQAQLQIRVTE